ncbi:hypothetical protein XA68_15047 [Ophiocordyceps unilateralis]|uniref:Cytochrome P450 n=1 Tax=Ophiocordyceps unilateralis TaxID=268505 RepID=A0A2A9P8W2_OPHUN|nr:hypothetical protein XA68_15047 [Ophiocordyceps unilateralis]
MVRPEPSLCLWIRPLQQGRSPPIMIAIHYLVAAVVIIGYCLLRRSRRPPGPYGLPLLGNVHQISRRYSWKQFQQWHKIYGPILSFRLGQITVILLGNHEVAKELLTRRSANYSSRPRLAVAGECIGKDFGAALLPYGNCWRQYHKIQMSFLSGPKSRLYRPLQELETRQLLSNLLSTSNFEAELYRFSSSLMFALLYGRRFVTGEESDLKQTEELATSALQVVSFGNWIVDIFPVLNCLPHFLAKWKRVGDDFHNRRAVLYDNNVANALARPSWNWSKQSFLHDAPSVSRKQLAFLLGELYETGSHTTSGALLVAILACVCYPQAMRSVQDELEAHVGPDRLPSFDDFPNLPYTQSFVQEVLRWRPLAPGGVPHSPIKDDTFEGFHIPKGATVIANHWSLDMDEDVFARPEEFMPERWIKNPDLPIAAFGFGRRTCPGQYLARNSILLVMSRLLWAYDIKWKEGKARSAETIEMTHDGVFSKPSPFEATFTIRNSAREKMVREWRDSDDDAESILNMIGAGFPHQ